MTAETKEQKIARLQRELHTIQTHNPPRVLDAEEVKRRNEVFDELKALGAFEEPAAAGSR